MSDRKALVSSSLPLIGIVIIALGGFFTSTYGGKYNYATDTQRLFESVGWLLLYVGVGALVAGLLLRRLHKIRVAESGH